MSPANQAQHEAWNGESGTRWVADADRRDAALAPVATSLLAAAHLRPGETVLDLGCGCGITTIAAADLVAPADVVGIDLSGPMLALARQRAGSRNAEFLQADAQTHPFDPGRFDVALARFGTMFFDDPVAAFANIATAMRPQGRMCLATWQPLEANDWLLLPGAALLQYGHLPDAASGAGPGMFSQSDPRVVTRVLTDAGWTSVEITPTRLTLTLGTDEHEALDYLVDTGIARAVLDTIEAPLLDEALRAVASILADHRTDDGVQLDGGVNLITATIL